MLWKIQDSPANLGWYTDVEVVDDNTAVAPVKDTQGASLSAAPPTGCRVGTFGQ